jgi:hypothetical protein
LLLQAADELAGLDIPPAEMPPSPREFAAEEVVGAPPPCRALDEKRRTVRKAVTKMYSPASLWPSAFTGHGSGLPL